MDGKITISLKELH